MATSWVLKPYHLVLNLPLYHALNKLAQNHIVRIAETGRDLWRPSGPIPLLRQGHIQQVVQGPAQMASEISQTLNIIQGNS